MHIQDAKMILPGNLNLRGGRSSDLDQLQENEGKVFGLDVMDELHLCAGLVPDANRLPPRFQEHLCEQLVDIATFPHTVGYCVNEAVKQNALLSQALMSINGTKTDLMLSGAPTDTQWHNPKRTIILSIKDQEMLDERLKELRESQQMEEALTLANIASVL